MKLLIIKFLATFALTIFLPLFGFGFSADLIEATQSVYCNNASEQQQVEVFVNNKIINHMRLKNVITNDVYQANQIFFQKINDTISEKAVKQAGLKYEKQIRLYTKDIYKPGTDTDIIVGSRNGYVTLNDIKLIRTLYNEEVEKFLIEHGYQVPQNIDWANITDTDFLVNPSETEEFELISLWINKNGGTAYAKASAAEVETNIRAKRVDISIIMAASYNDEMSRQINNTLKKLAKNRSNIIKLRETSHPEFSDQYQKLQNMLAIEHKLNSQIAKYLNRKYKISILIAEKFDVKFTYQIPKQVINALNRGPDTAEDAAYVGKNAEKLLNSANIEFYRVLTQGLTRLIFHKTAEIIYLRNPQCF